MPSRNTIQEAAPRRHNGLFTSADAIPAKFEAVPSAPCLSRNLIVATFMYENRVLIRSLNYTISNTHFVALKFLNIYEFFSQNLQKPNFNSYQITKTHLYIKKRFAFFVSCKTLDLSKSSLNLVIIFQFNI